MSIIRFFLFGFPVTLVNNLYFSSRNPCLMCDASQLLRFPECGFSSCLFRNVVAQSQAESVGRGERVVCPPPPPINLLRLLNPITSLKTHGNKSPPRRGNGGKSGKTTHQSRVPQKNIAFFIATLGRGEGVNSEWWISYRQGVTLRIGISFHVGKRARGGGEERGRRVLFRHVKYRWCSSSCRVKYSVRGVHLPSRGITRRWRNSLLDCIKKTSSTLSSFKVIYFHVGSIFFYQIFGKEIVNF